MTLEAKGSRMEDRNIIPATPTHLPPSWSWLLIRHCGELLPSVADSSSGPEDFIDLRL